MSSRKTKNQKSCSASILGAVALALTCAPVAQAQPIITNAPGYVITWNGNNGDNPTSLNVPTNIAGATQGALAYASGQLGPEINVPYHYVTNLNDGFYGNTKSWIGGTNDPTPWFAGIQLSNAVALTGQANVAQNQIRYQATTGHGCRIGMMLHPQALALRPGNQGGGGHRIIFHQQ